MKRPPVPGDFFTALFATDSLDQRRFCVVLSKRIGELGLSHSWYVLVPGGKVECWSEYNVAQNGYLCSPRKGDTQ